MRKYRVLHVLLGIASSTLILLSVIFYAANVGGTRRYEWYNGDIIKYSIVDNLLDPFDRIAGLMFDLGILCLIAAFVMAVIMVVNIIKDPGEYVDFKERRERRRAWRKQSKLDNIKCFDSDQLLRTVSICQAMIRLVYVVMSLLTVGSLIYFVIEWADYGISTALSMLLACLCLIAFCFLIFGLPTLCLVRHSKLIMQILEERSRGTAKMEEYKARLASSRVVNVVILCVLTILVPAIICGSLISGGSSGDDKTRTVSCGYCDREFSISSSDGKSISRRKLCENCYNNMNHMQDALDSWQN